MPTLPAGVSGGGAALLLRTEPRSLAEVACEIMARPLHLLESAVSEDHVASELGKKASVLMEERKAHDARAAAAAGKIPRAGGKKDGRPGDGADE